MLYQGNQRLPLLSDLKLVLTADQVFDWLKMKQ